MGTNYPVSTQAPSIFISSSSPTSYPVSTQAPSIFAFSPSKKSKYSKKSSKAPKSPESKKSSKSVKSLSPVSSPVADECIVCSNNPTRYMSYLLTKKTKRDRDPLSCEDYGEALEAKCNKHKEWIKEKYCQ